MKKRLIAFPAAVLMAVSLAACSSDAAQSGGQSVADATQSTYDACMVVDQGLGDINAAANEIGSAQSYENANEARIAMMPTLIEGLDDLTNTIGNVPVRDQLKSFTDTYRELFDAIKSDDETKIEAAETKATGALTTLSTTCQAAFAEEASQSE